MLLAEVTVIVSAKAEFDTNFMNLFGIDSVTVASSTTVRREVQGLEVVLVLDNTGSMNTNNNIEALRTASMRRLSGISKARRRLGSMRIWYSLTNPPTEATSDTPFTVASSNFKNQSCKLRSSDKS